MSKLLEDVAYSLGIQAYRKGKPRVPALDKVFLDNCLIDCKVGDGMPYLKAWIKGWDEGNLLVK